VKELRTGHKKNERFIFGKTNPIRGAGEPLSACRFAAPSARSVDLRAYSNAMGTSGRGVEYVLVLPSYEESNRANPRLTADKPSLSPTEPLP
jgi:hypothetical protein